MGGRFREAPRRVQPEAKGSGEFPVLLEVGAGTTGAGSDLLLPGSSGRSRDLHPGQNPEAQMEVWEHDLYFRLLLGNTLNYTEREVGGPKGRVSGTPEGVLWVAAHLQAGLACRQVGARLAM